jgi:integrase
LNCFFIEYDKTSINFKKIMKKIKEPNKNKRSGGEAWTTEQIQSMLKIAKTTKVRALIHVLASTACRVGSIPELKIKHVSDIENCKAILFYPDTTDEYFGFLTPEASQALQEYLTKREHDGEVISKESTLFRQTYQFGKEKAKPLSKQSIQVHIAKTIKHLERKKIGHRYNIQLDHGFRKRFNTIVKSNDAVNLTYAEKLMGHSVTIPLDESYISKDLNQLKKRVFQEFKKHITNLTIDDSARQQAINEALKTELSEKDLLLQEINGLKIEVADFKFITNAISDGRSWKVRTDKDGKIVELKAN